MSAITGNTALAIKRLMHEMTTYRYANGESYGIPYCCLLPQGIENALVAGRCVSTDHYLLGSLRVMPGCYITGQVAGMAAALAVEAHTTPRGVDIAVLQRRLLKVGGDLPNAKSDPSYV
jgi:hypothetical protein